MAKLSDHFDGRRFYNPGAPAGKSFWGVLKWKLTDPGKPWPRWVDGDSRHQPLAEAGPQDVVITCVNHATVLLQVGGVNILTDPVYSQRASPVSFAGPRRVRPPGVDWEALPQVHTVLVSHNHYDHMDARTLRRLEARFGMAVVTPVGNERYLRSFGLRRVVELDWWEAHELQGQVRITAVPARHFSARSLLDRNRALWAGFVLEGAGRKVYFAGDTAYGEHFREIRQRLGNMDAALWPIGAYEPRWFMKDVHMDPEEVVRAHLDLGAHLGIAMHFGTFRLANEGIDDPPAALREAIRRQGISEQSFRVPGFGESILLAPH